DLGLARARLPEHDGARNIRRVALDLHAVVDHHHVTFLQLLRRGAAVGQGGVLAELDAHETGEAKRGEPGHDVVLEFVLRHPVTHGLEAGLVRSDRHVVRPLHQRDLGLRLDHAAARGHRSCVDDLRARRCLANSIGDEKAHALLHADAVVLLAAVLHDSGDHGVRALVLLPHAHLIAERGLELLAEAVLLEAGRDVADRAVRRDHHAERALALAPAHGRVIEATRGAFHEDRVELLLTHELLRLDDPSLSFVVADGDDAVLHRLQRADDIGQLGRAARGRAAGAVRIAREGEGSRADGSGLEKATTIDTHGIPLIRGQTTDGRRQLARDWYNCGAQTPLSRAIRSRMNQMARKHVESKRGPAALGPYSPGVWAGKLLYLSGQTPVDPETGKLIGGDVDAQTMRAFDNLELVLGDAGLSMDDVIKCNVYLTDMADFPAMNAAYGRRLG